MNLNNIIQYNPDWFELAVLPSGIDKQTLKETIIFRCGLLTPVYGEPDLFQKFVGHWFAKQYNNIERLISLYAAEYDPLRNYDRTEEYDGTDTDRLQHGKVTTNNLSEGHTGTDQTDRKTSAMNESTYQPDNHEDLTHGETITNTGTVTDSGTDVTTKTINHDNHIYGNIGVTTSQQMWIQENELLRDHNIYNEIAILFENEMMLGVY